MGIYEQARPPERVWEYNWAISQAAGVTDELADFSREAEAAMTLADAEIEKGMALMREKVARARAERDDALGERDRLREELRTEEQVSVALRRELERERTLRATIEHGGGECADGHVMTTDVWANGDPVSGRRCHFCKAEESAE